MLRWDGIERRSHFKRLETYFYSHCMYVLKTLYVCVYISIQTLTHIYSDIYTHTQMAKLFVLTSLEYNERQAAMRQGLILKR